MTTVRLPDEQGIPYLPTEAATGAPEHTFDVYYPEGGKTQALNPAVLWFHQGSFKASSPQGQLSYTGYEKTVYRALTEQGLTVFNIGLSGVGYTLGDPCLYEPVGSAGWNNLKVVNPWKDAQHAIQHIKQNALSYGVDPTRLVSFHVSSPSLCVGRIALGSFHPMTGVTSPQGSQRTQLLGWLGHSTVGWLNAWDLDGMPGVVFRSFADPTKRSFWLRDSLQADVIDSCISTALREPNPQAKGTACMMVHEEVADPAVPAEARHADGSPSHFDRGAALHDVIFGQLMVEDLLAAGCPSIVGACADAAAAFGTYPAATVTFPAQETAFGQTAEQLMVDWIRGISQVPAPRRMLTRSDGLRITGRSKVTVAKASISPTNASAG